jgi:cell division transport system permease protein
MASVTSSGIPIRANRSFKRRLTDHLDACLDSLGRFVLSPFQTIITLLVIAVALCLPSMLYMLVKSVESGMIDVQQSADISVYFSPGIDEETSLQVQSEVLAMETVSAARFLSPERALQEFKEFSGLGDALGELQENPLPATLLVTPEMDQDIEALISRIESLDSVDQVQFDYVWLQRLRALLAVIDKVALVLALLLGAGVILILGNTIRLEIENRREEVAVIKLVGGTNAYVQRPLLYTGVWFGLLGALIAWFLTNLFAWLMSAPLDALGQLYLRDISLVGLDSMDLLILLALGVALGWLGAWMAAARHLASIEPV